MPHVLQRPKAKLRRSLGRSWRGATHGLARRFGLIQTGIILGFAVALGIGTDVLVARHIRGEVEQRALAMVSAQARLAGVQLADYRLEDLNIGLADLRRTKGVTGVLVADASGLLLSDGGAGGALFTPVVDPLMDLARVEGRPVAELRAHEVEAAAPIFLGADQLGAVRILLSLDSMDAQLNRLRSNTILVTVVFVVVGLAGNALLLQRTRRSLKGLVDVTKLAASGEFVRPTVVRTNDEVQQLAIGFNRMILRLRRSTMSRDHVNHIIQAMSEALLVIDAHGRITLANEAACRLFGHGEPALHRRSFGDLICRETTPGPSLLKEFVRQSPVETRIVTKGEGRIPVMISASAMPADNATVCLLQDLRVRKLAYFDTVTDLPNRVQFKQELARAVSEAQRARTKLAVFFVDLDQFKMINDSYGHDVGDRLLRGVADRLQGVLRASDVVALGTDEPLLARLGGDEFTIMARGLHSASEAARISERLLHAMSAPFALGEHQVLVGASIGMALFPDHGTEPEALIQNADRAMYWAKERGRNGARFFEPMMDTAANERLEVENELRRAIAVGGLTVYYQPQVDIPSGRVTGVEALVRWHHPKRGAISPATFIPIAETSGTIIPLDRWVLEVACQQLHRWDDQGLGSLVIAVNVSALTLQQEDFVAFVLGALEAGGIDPGKLEIEITERAAIGDLDDTVTKLQELRDAGVKIAIDDFGTGYSSLSYLKRLPADRLKIDRAFLEDAHRNSSDRVVFKAIVDMAKAVGMEVLAEGVETAGQLDFLRQLGCDAYQGFFTSPAIAADDVLPWLLERGAVAPPRPMRPSRRAGETTPANRYQPELAPT